MNKEILFGLHRDMCAHGLELMKKKNADYSKGDALGNFYLSEALQATTAEMGIITRMGDKMSRLVSIISKGKAEVETESVQDTIVDLINYSVLLAAVIAEKNGKYREINGVIYQRTAPLNEEKIQENNRN